MADATRPRRPAAPRYAGGWGRLVASPLYRATIGFLADNRVARMVLLAGLPLIWIGLMNIGPLLEMLRISLYATFPLQPGQEPEWTLANYRLFFQEQVYWRPFVRSLLMGVLVTGVTLVAVYPVAYYIAKVVRPDRRVRALLLLLLPFWAGELIRTFSVIMLLANRGAINWALREIGIIDRPIPMLYTTFSVSFGIVYLLALYMLLPLYSAIEKIPPSLIEAGADLGATPWQRFRRVILPLSKDGVIAGCSLVFLTNIGVYAAPLLLGGPSSTIFPEVIGQFFHSSNDNWPEGAAFSLLMLAAGLVTVGLFMRVAGGRAVKLM